MKQLVYFLMFGLVFTALQVTTVEAMHDQAHVDEMRATEDSALQTARETEDRTRQTMRETEDSTRQAARDQEDRERQAAEEAMNTAAGAGGHDCSHHPTEAARTACEADGGAGGQHDCSEIPDAAGRALCETAEARGTPPTAGECAQMPTEEGRNQCMEHAGGMAPGTQECRDGSGTVVPCPTGDDAPNAVQ